MYAPYHPVEIEEFPALRTFHHINDSEIIFFAKNPNVSSQPRIMNKFRDSSSSLNIGVKIKNIKSYAHPKTGVFIYKIETIDNKSLVYATDTEGYIGNDVRIIEFAKNADVLIHDAQYTDNEYLDPSLPKQGWGHSTFRMATDVAKAANVGSLYLFHHDPSHNDDKMDEIEKEARKLFKNTYVAREGMSVEV
jgi:ribonuclease BN (tRNA processing enzyme)